LRQAPDDKEFRKVIFTGYGFGMIETMGLLAVCLLIRRRKAASVL